MAGDFDIETATFLVLFITLILVLIDKTTKK